MWYSSQYTSRSINVLDPRTSIHVYVYFNKTVAESVSGHKRILSAAELLSRHGRPEARL